MDRRWKPSVEIKPNFPRCDSSNTKFCHYNNYNLTQPRYFCKDCRRYWTKGGSLRNVPVGGGCSKNRRGNSLLRMPTDGVPFKSLSSGLVPHYENKVNALSESNSSSAMSDGSHIDLTLVLANFLNNKQPENKSGFEVPELPNQFDPSLEFTNMEPNLQLPEENCLNGYLARSNLPIENHLSNNYQMYYSGLESIHKHQDGVQQCTGHETSNYALPPFPGDDLSSQEQELLWLNAHSSAVIPCKQLKSQFKDQKLTTQFCCLVIGVPLICLVMILSPGLEETICVH